MSADLTTCPNSFGVFKGVYREPGKLCGVRSQLRCKSWKCPFCNPIKIKQTRKRIFNGDIMDYARSGEVGQYDYKLLTLTCPGASFRSTYTPAQALDQMSQNLHKLIRAAKKKHGSFMYLKVLEAQRDGFPHFHILLVGRNIAHKGILKYIKDLWCKKYGMGFVKLNVIRGGSNSLIHAIRYITKYLTKQTNNIRKGARLFTASRGAVEKLPEKKDWIMQKLFIGCTTDDENCFIEREFDGITIPADVRKALSRKLELQIFADEMRQAFKLMREMPVTKPKSKF